MAKRGKPAKEVIEKPKEQKESNLRKSGKLIESGLLLLLKERPSHGYELLNRLLDLEINTDSIDPGTVYRTLRGMEKLGLVVSEWDVKGPGPARRIYGVTKAAKEEIDMCAKEVEKEIGLLEAFSERLSKYVIK